MTSVEDLQHLKLPIPADWQIIGAADTGTYMSAGFLLIPPGDEPTAIAVAEFPNYRYVAHEIELLGISNPEWARRILTCAKALRPSLDRVSLWCDPNTQFRHELAHYGIDLRSNSRKLELRVEIAREYMQGTIAGWDATDSRRHRLFFTPWLSVLPYEIEHAKWPDGTTGSGKFERLKEHDHTLDFMEHALSRRPRSKRIFHQKKKSFLQQFYEQHRRADQPKADPHLGSL